MALVVFNTLLLQKDHKLEKDISQLSQNIEPPSFSPLLTAGVQPFCFTFVSPRTGEAYKPKLLLLVFFSTRDCITCLQEVSVWRDLYEEYHSKGMKILGVVPSDDSLQMEKFVEAESLNVPIMYVDSIYIKQHLGIPQTPFKVLMDSTLTVMYLNGPNPEVENQQRFRKVIEKWCALSL